MIDQELLQATVDFQRNRERTSYLLERSGMRDVMWYDIAAASAQLVGIR